MGGDPGATSDRGRVPVQPRLLRRRAARGPSGRTPPATRTAGMSRLRHQRGNPLSYSDYGFDTTGDEVHAGGEIWNGTDDGEVRQALVHEVRSRRFPSSGRGAPAPAAPRAPSSARSPLPATAVPRQPALDPADVRLVPAPAGAATSMLDARDATVAADRMRFGGAQRDRRALERLRPRRGMGARRVVPPNADSGDDATPSFAKGVDAPPVTCAGPAGVPRCLRRLRGEATPAVGPRPAPQATHRRAWSRADDAGPLRHLRAVSRRRAASTASSLTVEGSASAVAEHPACRT